MALIDLVLPKMGESIMEATVLKWLKNVGDTVNIDDPVLEVATDKVDSEVPATSAGTIKEILFSENEVVPIGAVIARIESTENANADAPVNAVAPVQTETKAQEIATPINVAPTPETQSTPPISNAENVIAENRFYSPLVLNIARNEGISMSDLEKIPGTGKEGRVTKQDILNHVNNKTNTAQSTTDNTIQPTAISVANVENNISSNSTRDEKPSATNASTTNIAGNVEIIEMDRMRKLIADHMVRSVHTSPHVTSFMEADVTEMVNWRNKNKVSFEKKYGDKITFTPIFIEAIVKCIKDFPLINSSLDGHNIIVKKDINIGMAAALPSGNLIVPVIRNADLKNLAGLSKEVNTLAQNARNNKLKPEDTQGGTFTLTNVGTFGSLMGTPIINQPQVAILAVGAIKKRPVVLETEAGDVIAIRHMMYLSMSYDHRIVDGSLGASFLTAVAKEFEAFNSKREL